MFLSSAGPPAPAAPQRIISLIPSLTELLCFLGLEDQIAGITKFCVHPSHLLQTKIKTGGTKNIDVEKIKALHPTLILSNKEENVKGQIEALAKDFPVWLTDVQDLQGAISMVKDVGIFTGTQPDAEALAQEIQFAFHNLENKISISKKRAAYLIWREPFMVAGGDTFISNMLSYAGFINVFEREPRYPTISIEALRAATPEVVLLSSEPFPFCQKHIDALQPHLPGTKILLADGEIFSWYGSRLLLVPAYFLQLQQNITLTKP